MRRFLRLSALAAALVGMVPALTYAQASITGVVRDTSGAVLPGVTVEAASPALIEKVRTAVTDGTGRFRIENLRPGLYEVTFQLPGFSTVRRSGIELIGTAASTVNADLRVGAVEETITVTGETPVVDVQSTARQTVIDEDAINSLPSSRVANVLVRVLPSVSTDVQDMGGLEGDGVARGDVVVRGNADARAVSGGVGLHGASGMSGATSTVSNIAAYTEMTVDAGGSSAEHVEGGVIINLIPRDGGNTFSGQLYADFANSAMQGDNFTQELRDAGLAAPNTLKQVSEFNPSFGGPIKRDRIWFYWAARHMTAYQQVPVFYNKNAGDATKWNYEPDVARGPATNENRMWDFSNIRTTWQINPKNKLAVTYDASDICDCPRGLTARLAPEAAVNNYQRVHRKLAIGQWTAPVTNRLLLEATVYSQWKGTPRSKENPFFPGGKARWDGEPGIAGQVPMISVQEQSTGLVYRATPSNHQTGDDVVMGSATASYVTGAHSFKAGFTYRAGVLDRPEFSVDAPLQYRFNNGVPNRLTQHARFRSLITNMDADNGLFVQDRWTMDRLTLTGGLRWDYLFISYPETHVGPTLYAPNRNITFPATDGLRWHDLSPRSGLAYDVFGDGTTAVKVSMNKYLRGTAIGTGDLTVVTTEIAPAARLVVNTTRSWRDTDGDFVADCDLTSAAANGECGAMANPDFGSTRAATNVDPDLLKGWGKRPYNWQFSAGVQRQIVPRLSLDVSYWRSWWGNFYVTDNRAISPADFDQFSFTAPSDPRLPGGGGYVVSGLYDIKPEKFGITPDNLFTMAEKFGDQTDLWTGVDLTINARPRGGVFLSGGTTIQRQTTDNCQVVANLDNPSQHNCHVTGTFLTQVKFIGSYTIPRIDVQVSGSFQNLPGPEMTALFVAPNALVSRSLGRNLAGGASNVEVDIVEPRSMYGDRLNRLDLRVGKIVPMGRLRGTFSVDVYNAFNSSTVLGVNDSFGNWLQPEQILQARFAKVGLLLSF
jgi:carboxypeptidase family protein